MDHKACYLLFCSVTILFHVRAANMQDIQTASVEVVIYENTGHDYTTYTYELKGSFSKAGAATSAEGDILQIHPLGLCNTSDDSDLYEYGWVGVVKLTPPSAENAPCFSLFQKAERAMQRGATAIIFDISGYPDAVAELNANKVKAKRPIVLIDGQDAKKLINIIKNQKLSRARIQYGVAGYTPQRSANEYLDMVIFMTFFILVSVICFILLLKIKWRQKQKETSLTRMALHALSRMETRKYQSDTCSLDRSRLDEESLAGSTTSLKKTEQSSKCVICLERFKNGQDVRIVPCRHEFHKDCVDPWLLSNFTCPLCMLNIVERENTKKKPPRAHRWLMMGCGRCFSSGENAPSAPINSILHQDIQVMQTQDSVINVPAEEENEKPNEGELGELKGIPLTSLNINSQSNSHRSNVSLIDMLNRNCIRHELYSSGLSVISQSENCTCYLPPFESPKDYTHQMVVVAPLTADLLDVSHEDIV